MRHLSFAFVLCSLLGCSDDPVDPLVTDDAGTTDDSGATTTDASVTNDSSVSTDSGATTDASVQSDAGSTTDAGGETDAQVEDKAVPTSVEELFAFLKAGEYLTGFEPESEVRESTVPHGPNKIFLSPELAASFAANNTVHPVGSAAIKELYESDKSTLKGWAVEVKIKAGSGAGTWYFYETFNTTDSSDPFISGVASEGTAVFSGCASCHSDGTDYVRIAYPLQ